VTIRGTFELVHDENTIMTDCVGSTFDNQLENFRAGRTIWPKHYSVSNNKEKKKGEYQPKLYRGGKIETKCQIYTMQQGAVYIITHISLK
jgi:hypothetical protein